MTPIVISPPFGNYRLPGTAGLTRIAGSFTVLPRPGRWRRVAATVRPTAWRLNPPGYVNAIGLRNPGLAHADLRDVVPSLAAIAPDDWTELYHQLTERIDYTIDGVKPIVELNLGCPNAGIVPPISTMELRRFCDRFRISVKLPATNRLVILGIALSAAATGASWLHVGNTLSTPRGGESGWNLIIFNLQTIQMLIKNGVTVSIIGGGGIYDWDDLVAYRDAGASIFSLSTVFFTPWRAAKLLRRARREGLI